MNRTDSMLACATSHDQVHVEDLHTNDMQKQGEKNVPRTLDAESAFVGHRTHVLSDSVGEVFLDDDHNSAIPCADATAILHDPVSSLSGIYEDPRPLHPNTVFRSVGARTLRRRHSALSDNFVVRDTSAPPSTDPADKENRPPPNFDVTSAANAETAVARTTSQRDSSPARGFTLPRWLFTSADDVLVDQDSDSGPLRSPQRDNFLGDSEATPAWETGFQHQMMTDLFARQRLPPISEDTATITIPGSSENAINNIHGNRIMEFGHEDFVPVPSQTSAINRAQNVNGSNVVSQSAAANNDVDEDEFVTICNTNTVCSEDLTDRDDDLTYFSPYSAPVAGVFGQKRYEMRPDNIRCITPHKPVDDLHGRSKCATAGSASLEADQSQESCATAQSRGLAPLNSPCSPTVIMNAHSSQDSGTAPGPSRLAAVAEQPDGAAETEDVSGMETPTSNCKRFRSPRSSRMDLSKRRKKTCGAAWKDEIELGSAVSSPVERRLSRSAPGKADTTSVVVMVESSFVSAIIKKLADIEEFLSSNTGSDVKIQFEHGSTLSPSAAQQRRVTFKGKGLTQVACIDSILRFIPVRALNSDEFEKTPEEVIFTISAKDRDAMIAYGMTQVSRDLSEFLRCKGHHMASRFMSVLLLETRALSTWKVKVLGVPKSWSRNVLDFFKPKVQYLEMDGTLLKDANAVLEGFGHDNDSVVAHLAIPQTDVPHLIGRGGSSLELLQKETSTLLAIDQCSKASGYSTLMIKGKSCKVCRFAKDRILRFLEQCSATSNTNETYRRASMSQ